jgi:hypothetical protein
MPRMTTSSKNSLEQYLVGPNSISESRPGISRDETVRQGVRLAA